jgi:predicted DNA-binding transcriptional regulator AlpA
MLPRRRRTTRRRVEPVVPARPIELITEAEARAILGGTKPLSKPTFYRGINAGRFPRGVRIAENSVRYSRAEVEDVVRALFAERG